LHPLLQNFISSHERSHFFLHSNDRLQYWQTLVSRKSFLCKANINQDKDKIELGSEQKLLLCNKH